MERGGISVIIVVKNGEKYLQKAIESVLNQAMKPDEILLVDGGSADRTLEIAGYYPEIKILIQKERGLANARNLGIYYANCDLIAFLDHDDYWPENKLEIQLEEFLKSPDLEYCYGQVQLFLEKGSDLRYGFKDHHFKEDLIGRTPGTLMAKKSLFDQIGYFDPEYSIACDVDWFTRAADLRRRAAYIPAILLHKRIHHSNLSSNVKTNKAELFKVIKESLDRQQKTGAKLQ